MLFLRKRRFGLDMLCLLSAVSHHLGARIGIVAFARTPITSRGGASVAVSKLAVSTPIRTLDTETPTSSSSSSSSSFDDRNVEDDEIEDYNELPLDFPRRKDVLIALAAVRKACKVTKAMQPECANDIKTVDKFDLSPVTVADFAAQAIVLNDLQCAFEHDSYIAEESRNPLDVDDNLAYQVWKASGMESMELVKQSIQLGKEYEKWDVHSPRPRRVWCLDPIDGTKGFLRGRRQGGQYAVALALLEDGVPTIGILGCPNLPTDPHDPNIAWKHGETMENNQNTRGCIFVASKDGGCYQLPVIPTSKKYSTTTRYGKRGVLPLRVTPNDGSVMTPRDGRFCIAVEKFWDALGRCPRVAYVLHGPQGINEHGQIIKAKRIDSQAKYAVLAQAGAEYYARFTQDGYREWIWDHAAGKVVIEEAGGIMTDLNGDPIDFSLGPQVSHNVRGVLASNGGMFHHALVRSFHIQEQDRIRRNL